MLSHPRIDLDCPRALEGSLCDAIAWSLCTPGALLHRTIQVLWPHQVPAGRWGQSFVQHSLLSIAANKAGLTCCPDRACCSHRFSCPLGELSTAPTCRNTLGACRWRTALTLACRQLQPHLVASAQPAAARDRAPGCVQSKKGRCFGGASPGQCYIRISVGHAHGTSPGDPLVMEIWPPGHSSPIHSHANTFGVVRVLHGTITGGAHVLARLMWGLYALWLTGWCCLVVAHAARCSRPAPELLLGSKVTVLSTA